MSKKAPEGPKSYRYYGTIAAVFGYGGGGVEAIEAILLDGERAYPPAETGPLLRSAAGVGNPHTIQVPDFGAVVIYWGEPGQAVDPALAAHGEHPAYEGLFYMVFRDCLLGAERDTMRNVQVVYRRRPVQTLVTGPAAALDAAGDASVLACLAEVLTHPAAGLGIPAGQIDSGAFQAVATALEAEAAPGARVSVLHSARSTLRAWVSQMAEYVDGWVRAGPDGRLTVGRWEVGGGAAGAVAPGAPGGWPVLDAAAFESWGGVRWDAPGRDEVPTALEVRFPDRARDYKDSADSVVSLAALAASPDGERREQLHLAHVTDRGIARAVATERLRRALADVLTARVTVRTASARRVDGAPLRPGDGVWLDVDPLPGGDGALALARVLGRQDPESGHTELEVQLDSAAAVRHWVPEWSTPVPAPDVVPPLWFQRTVALPAVSGETPQIVTLIPRTQGMWTGCEILFAPGAGEEFRVIQQQTHFALPLRVAAAVAPGDSVLRLSSLSGWADGVPGDLDIGRLRALVGAGSERDALDDRWIIVIVRKDTVTGQLLYQSNGDEWVEIVSVVGADAVAGPGVPADTYDVRVLRGRMRTRPLAFDHGGPWPDGLVHHEAWLVERARMRPVSHAWFRAAAVGGDVGLFRFRPYERRAAYEPAEAWAEAQRRTLALLPLGGFAAQSGPGWTPTWIYSFPQTHARAPRFVSHSPAFPAQAVAGVVAVAYSVTDSAGDLIRLIVRVRAPGSTVEEVVLDHQMAPTDAAAWSGTVTLPAGEGWHEMTIEAWDAVGLSARVGGQVYRAVAPTVVPPPSLSPSSRPVRAPVRVSIAPAPDADLAGRVEYRLGAGAWTMGSVGATVSVTVGPGVLLLARWSQPSGTSAVVSSVWPWDPNDTGDGAWRERHL